jgi:uncharacterized delta-60 repeat protein
MRFRFVAAVAAVLSIVAPSRLVFADAGDLDPTFGNSGRTVLGYFSSGSDVALQADGKSVAAASANGFHAVRYGTNGVLDGTFGSGGVSQEAFVGKNAVPSSIAIQPDGYIVVAGTAFTGTANMEFAVARYTPSGNLDATFGTGGETITAFGPGIDRGHALALQADGKIIVVGDADIAGDTAFALARYTTGGVLDGTFGIGGIVTTNATAAADFLEDVIVQPDGRIVAVGSRKSRAVDIALLRYEDDGDLDATFGTGGMVASPYEDTLDLGYSVALQPDGKILVGGTANLNPAVARFDSDGALDTSFADGGKTDLDGFGFFGYAYGLAVQPNGSIVVGGTMDNHAPTGQNFIVFRLLPNGRVDPTFKGGADRHQQPRQQPEQHRTAERRQHRRDRPSRS